MENFNELKLGPQLSRAITELGFEKPTPIQAQAIPVLLAGPTDFFGMAATGTGKTAAFGIPLIQRMDPTEDGVQAVVLCPTRELTVQTEKQINQLGLYVGVRAISIYGGASYGDQFRAIESGPAVIVATPGRLIDHLERGSVKLDKLRVVVLDEADEMISMGFKDALEFILQHAPAENRETWLFSATMSPGLRRVAENYLRDPKQAQVNRTEMLSGTVRQIYYTVREHNKPRVLCKLIDFADDFYGLVFCQTKALVTDLTEFLVSRGYRADCLHGDKDQRQRDRSMRLFRERNVNILVCTDVAARGIDVKELTHVINYSIPREAENYVHRIGRTARSGKEGIAMSLVTPGDMPLVTRVERFTKTKMEKGIFPSRKQISERRLEMALPEFLAIEGADKALEVLGDKWKETLATMTKEEIASRFLASAFPELFNPLEPEENIPPAGLPPSRVRGEEEARWPDAAP